MTDRKAEHQHQWQKGLQTLNYDAEQFKVRSSQLCKQVVLLSMLSLLPTHPHTPQPGTCLGLLGGKGQEEITACESPLGAIHGTGEVRHTGAGLGGTSTCFWQASGRLHR